MLGGEKLALHKIHNILSKEIFFVVNSKAYLRENL